MAANNQFLVQFGTGSPATYTGLSPTFTVFNVVGVGNTTPPSIAEISSTGLYQFTYSPVSPIAFVVDGTSSISDSTIRYVAGLLDPSTSYQPAYMSTLLTGMGNTLGSMATLGANNVTLMGTLADSIGSTLTDPSTMFGFLKRIQEFNEGNRSFTKSSGVFELWSRGVTHVLGASTYSGTSTMLISKTVTDSGSVITNT